MLGTDSTSSLIDGYAQVIARDLDAGRGCGAGDDLRLEGLMQHLEVMSQTLHPGSDELSDAVSDGVFEKISARLPDMARLVDRSSDQAAKARALDAVTGVFRGERVAQFSRHLESIGGDPGRRDVILLSRAMAKQTSVLEREHYIEALAPSMSAQGHEYRGWGYSKSLPNPNPNSVAVAKVWGSLKSNPMAFERVSHAINVDEAVNASINEVKETLWIAGSRNSYNTRALHVLLQGAAQSSMELKQKIFTAASAAFDVIQSSPFTKGETKEDLLAEVRSQLGVLRSELLAQGVPAEALNVDGLGLVQELRSAVKPPQGDMAASVAAALRGASIHAASHALSLLSDREYLNLATGLMQSLTQVRKDKTSEEVTALVNQMNGAQLNRLVNVYLLDEAFEDSRDAARFALTGLAQVVALRDDDPGDRIEFIQNLVPHMGRQGLKTDKGEHPNPESVAVAVVLANMKDEPAVFDLALRTIPLGAALHNMLAGGVFEKHTGDAVAYQFDVLKSIVDGAARTQRTDYKRQIASQAVWLMDKVSLAFLNPLKDQDIRPGDADRFFAACPELKKLRDQVREVRTSIENLYATMPDESP